MSAQYPFLVPAERLRDVRYPSKRSGTKYVGSVQVDRLVGVGRSS
jgi:hypothetical protein